MTIGLTGVVGGFGVAVLAGFGIGVRLEFMLGPIAYGIGSGLTTLVGVAVGAQDWKRAVRIAWTGGLAAFALIGAIGWVMALVPEQWSRLFTSDPKVIATTVGYITHVAPFYCLLGLAMVLGAGLDGVFVAIGIATVLYGAVMAVPLLVKPWGPKRARLAAVTGATGASDGPPPVPTVDDRHLEPKPR